MSKTKLTICPYCGETQPVGQRCVVCGGLFEPLSRRASHNAMGPWFVRDPNRPFQPGCSYETLVRLVERGQVTRYSVIRGPTTRQFWTIARHVPGVAHLLGYCHDCDASVDPGDHGCHACGVPFGAYLDRNYLGLPEINPMPWEADAGQDRPEDGRLGAADVFSGDVRPAGRLSSFATDAELLGEAQTVARGAAPAEEARSAGPATLRDAPTSDPRSAPARAEPRAPMAGNGDRAQSTALRAMQRRLASQQRTLRVVLVVAVVASLVAAVQFAIILARPTGESSATPPPVNGSEAEAADTQAQLSQQVTSTETSGQAANTHSTEAPPTLAIPELQLPAVTGRDEPGDDAVDSDYDRAMALIEAAADATRSVDDRLADYERALSLLRTIASQPGAEQPDLLQEQIASVEHEIERLKLKEFFPDS